MDGGEDGQAGLNSVHVMDQMTGKMRIVNLGAKATSLQPSWVPGESVIIESPGAGRLGCEQQTLTQQLFDGCKL
ncbi:hypothetical protein J3459_018437 [Metarhizium acridum]|nr:hypothetical protein J3459_018437 [Metarhizium acridum]